MTRLVTSSKPIFTRDTPLPYTASPWRLLWSDLRLAARFCRYIPWLFYPLYHPSGPIDELCPTPENLFVIEVHIILFVYQVAFLLSLPILFSWFLPAPFLAAYIVLAYRLNEAVCSCTLNTGPQIVQPTYPLVEQRNHVHERWIFLNGITVGTHWMQHSVNRLSQIFVRPVRGIHTPTSGLVFDLIRCLIQRNFCYATQDVRDAYELIKETLWDDDCHKLILIAHSQGGIATSLIIDWLVGEISQGHLQKLEIYTFGNAANHFNDPRRLFPGEDGRGAVPSPRDQGPSAGQSRMPIALPLPPQINPVQVRTMARSPSLSLLDAVGQRTAGSPSQPPPPPQQPEAAWRRVPFIEHYANSDDFVCRWGVTHFINMRNRYLGNLFQRQSPGHLFIQHYLDPMFPLDESGLVRERNDFFTSIEMDPASVHVTVKCRHNDPAWHLSRLWRYRGGRSPLDNYGI